MGSFFEPHLRETVKKKRETVTIITAAILFLL